MARVSRRSDGVRLELETDEAAEIDGLLDQLANLLAPERSVDTAPNDEAGDTLAGLEWPAPTLAGLEWPAPTLAGLEWPGGDPVEIPDDPAVRRLLPDAYRDDPEAAAEFRRYTELTLRDEMAADIAGVRTDVQALSAEPHRLTLTGEGAEAWLRVLNRLRLVLAVRLGIETAHDQEVLEYVDPGDPRAEPFLLYEWIGFLLGSLLRALR